MMRVPGANVLRKAFNAVFRDELHYYQAIGNSLNDIGQRVSEFLPGVIVRGSFQPVTRNKFVHLGLDLQKSYSYFYISKNMIDLTRDISADQLGFQGRRYQVESSTKWYHIDGWMQLLCVDIGLDSGYTDTIALGQPENFSNSNFQPDDNNRGRVNDG